MSMPKHSRTSRFRVRSALTAVLVAAGAVGVVGTAQAQSPDVVAGTPCTEEARACVDLDAQKAWLLDDGEIVRGPVPISSGGPGRETPRGDFRVEWKDAEHRSAEFNGAPMPYSVFFAQGGIAFHEGNLHTPSAGCVRLNYEDAAAFYEFLAIDDPVQVR
jgi:hypothetical protein